MAITTCTQRRYDHRLKERVRSANGRSRVRSQLIAIDQTRKSSAFGVISRTFSSCSMRTQIESNSGRGNDTPGPHAAFFCRPACEVSLFAIREIWSLSIAVRFRPLSQRLGQESVSLLQLRSRRQSTRPVVRVSRSRATPRSRTSLSCSRVARLHPRASFWSCPSWTWQNWRRPDRKRSSRCTSPGRCLELLGQGWEPVWTQTTGRSPAWHARSPCRDESVD
jgi:hypothetical protein